MDLNHTWKQTLIDDDDVWLWCEKWLWIKIVQRKCIKHEFKGFHTDDLCSFIAITYI